LWGERNCRLHGSVSHRGEDALWSLVHRQQPAVLGFDLRDTEQLDLHWDTITNTDAIAVNQDYAGHSGTLFFQSASVTTFTACDWTAGVRCDWPSVMGWYKPLVCAVSLLLCCLLA